MSEDLMVLVFYLFSFLVGLVGGSLMTAVYLKYVRANSEPTEETVDVDELPPKRKY